MAAEGLQDFGHYVLTIASTFVGAAAAFLLTNLREKSRKKADEYQAGLDAQFALLAQYNKLHSINKQHLDPLKDDDERHRLVKPITQPGTLHALDFTKINFLISRKFTTIKQGRFSNLLLELSVTQEKLNTLLDGLNERNRIHLNYQKELRTILDSRMLVNAPMRKEDYAIPPYEQQLKDLTDDIYELTEQLMDELQLDFLDLGEAIRYGFIERPIIAEFNR